VKGKKEEGGFKTRRKKKVGLWPEKKGGEEGILSTKQKTNLREEKGTG